MSKKGVDQNTLLHLITLMREDVESVMDVLEGNSTVAECWDTSVYNNWVAMQNLLCDIYDYIDCVVEDPETGVVTYTSDDSPPEDEIDESEVGDDYKEGTNG